MASALSAGTMEVTLVAHVLHDGTSSVTDWLNFNYLFNPKEQTVLSDDATYDADTTDPSNPLGSPWSLADNSTGDFSPALRIQEVSPPVEVPTTTMLGLAALVGAIVIAGHVILGRRSG